MAGEQMGLIEAFLNPLAYAARETDPGVAAGEIVRGMTRQVGNEIDEFVTEALRNNLLGLPLDLATINLARGRDTGIPSLNAARREFFAGTGGDCQLKPYESWVDSGWRSSTPSRWSTSSPPTVCTRRSSTRPRSPTSAPRRSPSSWARSTPRPTLSTS